MAVQPLSEKLQNDDFALSHVIRDVDDCGQWHDQLITTIEKRHKAYRGVLEKQSEAAKWTSKLHPPYLFQVIETIVANLIEDRLDFEVTPRPRPDSTPDEHRRMIAGAKAHEALLEYENDIDRIDEKQRVIALEACINGLAVGKLYWDYRSMPIQTQEQQMEAVQDEVGNVIGYVPVWKPVTKQRILRDDPCFEPVDLRDFFWDESATSLDRARWCCHRVWMTLDELLHLKQLGIFDFSEEDLGNVEEIHRESEFSREDELLQRNRTKGLYEVLEYWTNDRVIAVIDRRILGRNDPNPFDHGMKPFVEFSTMPQPFQVGGVSDVELTKHIQDAMWLMLNQRIDNVNLLNNSIIVMRADVEDPDDYEFGPGERWLVEDPAQVTTLQMNDTPAQISLESERLLKGDLMDVTGGMPFTAGLPNSTENQTATGASIYQTVAQRRLASRKQQLMYSWRKVGQMKLWLLQQFITEKRLLPILGAGGTRDFVEILPEMLEGDFDADIKPMGESLMRQERRAEALSRFQAAVQAAPVMQATGAPLNMAAFVEDWLENNGITDPERFMAPQTQQNMMGMQPQQPQMPGGAMGGQNMQGSVQNPAQGIPPIQQPGGMTNPSLAAGTTAPSNATSISPAAAMQQMMAMRGGGRTG